MASIVYCTNPYTVFIARANGNGKSPNPNSSWTALLIIVILIVTAALVLYARYKHKKYIEQRVLKAVYDAVGVHMRALVRKRFQTLRHDDYGNPVVEPWLKELNYFLSTVVELAKTNGVLLLHHTDLRGIDDLLV